MAQKAIREYDAKSILARHWDKYFPDFTYAHETVLVKNGDELKEVAKTHSWLNEKSLVGEAFRRIARRIEGEDIEFLDLKSKKGFLGKLKGLFK